MFQPRHGVKPERAAGHRDADGARVGLGELRRQVRHPGRRLGLAVHHEEFPAAAAAQLGVVADRVRRQAAAGLGDVAQAGQLHVLEPDPLQQVEGVRDRREGRRPRRRKRSQKHGSTTERPVRTSGAADQVAVDHGQAVAVGHRQRRGRAVVGAEREVLGNGLRVGLQVRVREPDQLGRAGRAGGAEQQGQVGVQVVAGAVLGVRPRRPPVTG